MRDAPSIPETPAAVRSGSAHARGGRRAPRAPPVAMFVASALVAAALLAATAALPYFSESHSHLVRVAGYSSWLEIFDPTQVPLRPLQHGYFLLLAALGSPEPWVARLPAFGLHLASALLVADLARSLGCSRAATWLALLGYLCFPSVKALVWVAAIGNPGRVACVLLGLCLYARHLERPRAVTGAGVLAAQVFALGFHQSGIVLAPACALLAWASAGGPVRRGWTPVARPLREPWSLALLALVAAYTLAMGVIWSHRYPHSAPLAIVANAARASLSLVPETLRHPAIEGLRRQWGGAGFAFGATAVVGVGAAYLALLRASAPRARALLLVAGLDLLLPVLSVGFVVRYAQLAAALGACVLGLWLDGLSARTRARRTLLAGATLLLAGLVADTVRDVREYRHAGTIVRAVLADAREVRERVGPAAVVALVDLPEVFGRERDVPLFNWGTRRALAAAGAGGPWKLLRTRPGVGSTESRRISPRDLERLRHPVLVFDPRRERLVELPPPAPPEPAR